MGTGVGVVALKRMTEALADGDVIHAVILGSAVNNDGRVRVGYTAPGVDGQAEVIETALAVAGVKPESVGYVECHATGTAAGRLDRAGGDEPGVPADAGRRRACSARSSRASGTWTAASGVRADRAALCLRERGAAGDAELRGAEPAMAARRWTGSGS